MRPEINDLQFEIGNIQVGDKTQSENNSPVFYIALCDA